ncbi:hypothetical protein DN824_21915 [Stutzerimonas nosocomialis]|uniref:DUF1643 domain-containing protein n=1 Tax=Stutzerimonas nosocomialis TaxID=1056496 RepID=UPI0011087228|nr:DUF1643 domain-containing protein [Stutzerimonas nosocomialis]TLX52768.1 hypothetical protein DN824_21915 [Stutzerimonas nosocomialis]
MSAVISECGKYRYRLEREVQMDGKVFAFFGVNPSTADASVDDATVRKWIGFTKVNGGRRFIVGNVFALRSTDVNALKSAPDPVGPDNADHLMAIASAADILVPCWGSRGKLPKELHFHLAQTLTLLAATGKPILTFGLSKSGDPLHPLMLGYSTQLVPYAA